MHKVQAVGHSAEKLGDTGAQADPYPWTLAKDDQSCRTYRRQHVGSARLQVEKYVVEVSGERYGQRAPQYRCWHMCDFAQEQMPTPGECHSKHEEGEVIQQRRHVGTAKPVLPHPALQEFATDESGYAPGAPPHQPPEGRKQ